MKVFSELRKISSFLSKSKNDWAVCGGIAASLYRDIPRLTTDIDIAITDSEKRKAKDAAKEALQKLGYKPALGFIPHPDGSSRQCNALIMCRVSNNERFVGIDFLLPVIPWVSTSVERAQANKIDYGFAKLPTITSEDLLLAKFSAISTSPDRPYDYDDAKSIIQHQKNLDFDYVKLQSKLLNIKIPKQFSNYIYKK